MDDNRPEYIINRESWFRIILISVFSLVACAAILVTPYKIDFSKIGFSDFLSLSLTIFSISLSAAFYFKATDTSNRFYDNTYKFMKDISENLGRIEERFGEQLKHLDEGYTGISDALLKGYQGEHEEIEKERQHVEQKINELVDKAPATDKEKDYLRNELTRVNNQIATLTALLNDKQRHLDGSREPGFSALLGWLCHQNRRPQPRYPPIERFAREILFRHVHAEREREQKRPPPRQRSRHSPPLRRADRRRRAGGRRGSDRSPGSPAER